MDDSDSLSALRRELRDELGAERCDVWLGEQTEFRYENRALHILCRSGPEMELLRRRLNQTLESCCRKVWGLGAPIVYTVRPPAPTATGDVAPTATNTSTNQLAVASKTARNEPVGSGNRSRLTFQTLAVGQSNRLAVGAVRAAVEQPGRFSPLLLFGIHGVGKTHVLQAAASEIRQVRTRPAVLQMTAEQFTGQFMTALAERTLPNLRQKCRTVDALLVDDVHFLIGKKATLEELLYTIDAIHQRGGQIILTADRAPNEFPSAARELTAKLSGGLSMQLDPPDYQMRLTIVRSVARRVNVELGPGTPELIAQRIIGSARLLSGAINRLVATSMALGRPITVDLAVPVLADFSQQNTPQVKLADVQRAVCEVFGVEPTSLKSERRTRGLVDPRMIAMWLARRYTRAALSEIGDYFGRRSHSTVVAAQKKCDRLVSQKANLIVGDANCTIDDAIRKVEAALRTA